MVPHKLEIRLGDVTLEDQMPLHFYEIMNGSKLKVIKRYVDVTIMNNKGTEIFWRLKSRDTIKEVKAKLAVVQNSSGSTRSLSDLQYGTSFSGQISGGYFPDSGISAEASRLYFDAEGQNLTMMKLLKTTRSKMTTGCFSCPTDGQLIMKSSLQNISEIYRVLSLKTPAWESS